MQTPSSNLKLSHKDPLWCFLAEFSLREWITEIDTGEASSNGLTFQTIRDLKIPPESLQNMKKTLAAFAREVMAHANQGRIGLPVTIRLFCRKKMVEDGNSMRGGWGYFLIERGESDLASSPLNTRNSIDMYLYQEGE